jgi:hypothetical protein
MSLRLDRRTFLRGLGTTIALPCLEGMLPNLAYSQGAAAAGAARPLRLGWVYVPNGIHMQAWTPAAVGRNYELTPTLRPLEPFKNKFMVISGLVCDKARPNGDGPGDHARAMSAFLTGSQPRKTEGANIRVGISVDQAAADRIGHLSRFPSLELGIEEGSQVGRCDSGYSCAYSHNLSWRNESTPAVKDCNPQSVFDRLFASENPRESAQVRAQRQADRRSILDYVLEDVASVQGRIGAADQRKLDEYLSSLRDIELRLNRTAQPTPPPAGATRPTAASGRRPYPDHVRLMIDLMVIAFQADLTRVVTLPFANEGSNQTYPWAGAPVPHHGTSHHSGNASKQESLAKINHYHITHLAYLLQRLDSIQEGNGATILDNTLIGYGSGNSDGQRHNHDNLPILLCGRGGNTVSTGRHVRFNDVPLNNLWLSMLERVGDTRRSLGDSTGKLELS